MRNIRQFYQRRPGPDVYTGPNISISDGVLVVWERWVVEAGVLSTPSVSTACLSFLRAGGVAIFQMYMVLHCEGRPTYIQSRLPGAYGMCIGPMYPHSEILRADRCMQRSVLSLILASRIAYRQPNVN